MTHHDSLPPSADKLLRILAICAVLALVTAPMSALAVPGATSTTTPTIAPPTPGDSGTTGTAPNPGNSLIAAPTAADNNLPLDQQVTKFEAALNNLNTQLEIVSEQINESHDKLAAVQDEIASRQAQLDAVQQTYDAEVAAYGARVSAAYQEGSLGYLDLLLSSQNLSSLIAKYDYISSTTSSTAVQSSEIATQKKTLEDELAKLRADEVAARSADFQLSAKQIEMTYRQGEYQQLFDTASTSVLARYNQNIAARKQNDAKLLSQFLSGGYTVEPGSVVETALAYRGIPYVWGGSSKTGFDCSGLVMFVFKQHGVKLPHSSLTQSQMGTAVSVSQLQPGDCVFFGSPVHHVGIYIGGQYFIQAPQTGDVVKVSKLTSMGDYTCARRFDWKPRKGNPL